MHRKQLTWPLDQQTTKKLSQIHLSVILHQFLWYELNSSFCSSYRYCILFIYELHSLVLFQSIEAEFAGFSFVYGRLAQTSHAELGGLQCNCCMSWIYFRFTIFWLIGLSNDSFLSNLLWLEIYFGCFFKLNPTA